MEWRSEARPAQRNITIDLAKYAASLLIIGIHTGLGADLNNTMGFFIVEIVCRLAVPFFAVSTGYFLADRLAFGSGSVNQSVNRSVLLKQEKKQLRLYIIWSLLYLFYSIPSWIRTGWFSPWAFVDYAIGAVRDGSHYHLWYILSLIYALPIIYLLIPIIKKSLLLPVSLCLYTVMIVFYSYNWCLPAESKILRIMSFSFPVTAAVFLLVPMLLLGMMIGKRSVLPMRTAIIGLMGSFALLCMEAFWLRGSGHSKYSYIVFTYPTAYFLFQMLLNIRAERKVFTKLARISVFVYCFHPMAVEVLGKIVKSSVVLFLMTAVIATAVGLICVELKRKMERKSVCFR